MLRKMAAGAAVIALVLLLSGCTTSEEKPAVEAGGQVRLITLDPGHFHAGLVQKTMYSQVSPIVHVYAPGGLDLDEHLKRIEAFNTRAENPTHWEEKVYTGPDYLEKMLEEKAGNVVVIAGNNARKTEYIKKSVDAGFNVLADKPMCIDPAGFEMLKTAFDDAARNNVLLYDIMTERHEITTLLQKALVHTPEVFGELQPGTVDDPSVTKESVHHFFKYVSGKALIRPAWYFDTKQQGEGIVDVATHLVDLVMWESYPEQIIDYNSDIQMLKARRWPTLITLDQFKKVTGLDDFPDFLKSQLNDQGVLPCYANGEMVYKLKGIHAKVSVIWKFEAPEGAGDTHYSVMKGTRSSVIIRQGKEQNYQPELYVEAAAGQSREELEGALKKAIENLQPQYPGIGLMAEDQSWRISIPDKYRVGHEAHFGQVTEDYLGFLAKHQMPGWEVPNMLAKYYTTMQALEMARQGTE